MMKIEKTSKQYANQKRQEKWLKCGHDRHTKKKQTIVVCEKWGQ